ncbi:RNA-directed DNA polymerase, eukaryota, reverse transcriptase zinc-binding domain protein [Tanacetum coccineum]
MSLVQFSPSLFHKHNSAWSFSKFGGKTVNANGSLNIESFAKKMRKGMDDRELQMNYVLHFVSKLDNGARRIDIFIDDIKRGAKAYSLQLYGYFVGTSMDYRVVNANLKELTTKAIMDAVKADNMASSKGVNVNGIEDDFLWWKNKKNSQFIPKSYSQKQADSVCLKGSGLVQKPLLNSKYKENMFHKVLVRGSSSGSSSLGAMVEDIPATNSFRALDNQDMVDKDGDFLNLVDDEFNSVVWPQLRKEVELVMTSGIYPFKDVINDWGLNKVSHQNEVTHMVRKGGYSMCGLLETHVKKSKLSRIYSHVLGDWDWVLNSSSCVGGTRIIIGWDPKMVNVMVMEQTSRAVHCFIEPFNSQKSFHYDPWVIMGDFNVTLDPAEKSTGGSKITTSMSDFRVCVDNIDVDDVASCGVWKQNIDGYAMFSLVSKLKLLKKPLRKFRFDQGNVFNNAEIICLKALNSAMKDQENFLRQNSKVEWLSEGDNNSRTNVNAISEDCKAPGQMVILLASLKVLECGGPISCCNVICKIISKVISNKMKHYLGSLVDENQYAFIPSR